MLRQSCLLKILSREELWIQAVGRRVAFTDRVYIKTKGNGSAVPAPEINCLCTLQYNNGLWSWKDKSMRSLRQTQIKFGKTASTNVRKYMHHKYVIGKYFSERITHLWYLRHVCLYSCLPTNLFTAAFHPWSLQLYHFHQHTSFSPRQKPPSGNGIASYNHVIMVIAHYWQKAICHLKTRLMTLLSPYQLELSLLSM